MLVTHAVSVLASTGVSMIVLYACDGRKACRGRLCFDALLMIACPIVFHLVMNGMLLDATASFRTGETCTVLLRFCKSRNQSGNAELLHAAWPGCQALRSLHVRWPRPAVVAGWPSSGS